MHSYHGLLKCDMVIFLRLVPLKTDLSWKMKNKTRTISLKTFKASTANPNKKPLPGDKTLGVEVAISLYEIEDGDKT